MDNNFKIRDKRNKGWFYLDNEYLNGFGKEFGAIGVAVYVCLCRHANNQQESFPSHKTIAEELSITEKTVKKYLKVMKEHNIFKVEQRRNKSGKFLHNVYTLMDKSVWKYPKGIKLPTVREGTKFHSRRVIDSTTVGNVVPTNNTNIRYTNRRSSSSFKKKPYFRGEAMRKSNGKWWVLPGDGGEWLEFNASESEIEWK